VGPQEDRDERLRSNAQYVDSKYEYFYLRTIQVDNEAPIFRVMARVRAAPGVRDHQLVETRNRHVAYLTLEVLKVAKLVVDCILKNRST
jgi:hypothetical protein